MRSFDWEHKGALPPGWELGYVVVAWCAGQRDGMDGPIGYTGADPLVCLIPTPTW